MDQNLYKIVVCIQTEETPSEIAKMLQKSFDGGCVDGTFSVNTVKPTDRQWAYITFGRDLAADSDYLCGRIKASNFHISSNEAARLQLAAELREGSEEDFVTRAVIAALELSAEVSFPAPLKECAVA